MGQRFELKFRIRPEKATHIRHFVSGYLHLDSFGASQRDRSYDVHSIYLDSDDLRLYRSTLNGDRNRIKLRLRYYDNDSTGPVYFEVKRRTNNCITKSRACVRRSAVASLIEGVNPEREHVHRPEDHHLASLNAFSDLMGSIGARPRAHVAYRREAWVSTHPTGPRVTFDRAVRCEPHFSSNIRTRMEFPSTVFRNEVVLELKFLEHCPAWLLDMVRTFNLVGLGAAKNTDGLAPVGDKPAPGRAKNSRARPNERFSEPAGSSRGSPAHSSRTDLKAGTVYP